jgi:hypothetical protein
MTGVEFMLDQANVDLDEVEGVVAEDMTGCLWRGKLTNAGVEGASWRWWWPR